MVTVTLTFIAALFASYLLGSIPFAWIVGKARGVDVRSVGSGNLGATNVARSLGAPYGVLVFLLDFLKGFVPVFFFAVWVVERSLTPWSPDATALALGVAAVLGHVFPVWFGFRGGKGVATSAGFFAGLCWPAVAISLGIWLLIFGLSRYVSVASMTAAILFPVVFLLWVGPERALGDRYLVLWLAVALALAIVYLHRANIGRLLRGEELRAGRGKTAERTS